MIRARVYTYGYPNLSPQRDKGSIETTHYIIATLLGSFVLLPVFLSSEKRCRARTTGLPVVFVLICAGTFPHCTISHYFLGATFSSMASIAGQGLKLNLNSNSDKTDASDSIHPTQKSYTSMSFKDKYSIHERIGKGAYATVHRCRRKSDDKDFAVKNIDLRPLKLQNTYDPDRIIREVRVHGTLVHPNIVKLEETYWTRSDGSVPLSPSEYDRLLIVLEYAPGKELFDEILEKKKIEEERARNISIKVLDAIAYIHNVNILHRDIKPENILLTDDGNVKLLDFGLSRSVGSGSYAKTFAGTPEYFALEVDPKRRAGGATEGYGVKADCYSLGACIYVMLSGIFPEFEARPDGTKVPSFDEKAIGKAYLPMPKI